MRRLLAVSQVSDEGPEKYAFSGGNFAFLCLIEIEFARVRAIVGGRMPREMLPLGRDSFKGFFAIASIVVLFS